MSDLIGRQDFLRAFEEMCSCTDYEWDERDFRDLIKRFPSAETEIIKCKDCKFYIPMNRKTKTGICSLTMHQNFGDEWYCAGAERKTDE